MWPSNEMKRLQAESDLDESIQATLEMDRVTRHFEPDGIDPSVSPWFKNLFSMNTIRITKADVLLKRGYCEFCKNYVGVSRKKRIINNVSVLSGYCDIFDNAVKHDTKACSIFKPNSFYMKLIEKEVGDEIDKYYTKRLKYWKI